MMAESPPSWFLYLVRRDDGALYTGISLDVDRRFREHLSGRGAKALRGRSLELVYRVKVGERALALRAERRVKALDKRAKERLLLEAPGCSALLQRLSLQAVVD